MTTSPAIQSGPTTTPRRPRPSTPRTPFGLARALSPRAPGSRIFLALTIVRIGFVVPVAMTGRPLLASIALAVFILWDVYDGHLARRFTVDSPLRRMADAYTDRTFILLVVGAFAVADVRWAPFLALLLGRDLAMWIGLQRIFTRTGACLLGGRPSKHTALVWAAWVYASLWLGFTPVTVLLACVWAAMKVAVGVTMGLSARGTVCDPPRVLVVERWSTRFAVDREPAGAVR